MPAAVVHSHASLFAATRRIRLTRAPPAGHRAGAVRAAGRRTPPASSPSTRPCATGTSWRSCPARAATFAQQRRGGAGRHRAVAADRRVRLRGHLGGTGPLRPEPAGPGARCAIWFNTGDCAHEAHIRRLVAVGSHLEYTRDGVVTRVPGSRFVDGIGSTEMGHSAFHITHQPGTDRYGRCVGKPYVVRRGRPARPGDRCRRYRSGRSGTLGLKSPTLAPGYWNDSLTTYRHPVPGLVPDRRPDVPGRGRLLLPRGPGGRRGRPGRRELALHRPVRGADPGRAARTCATAPWSRCREDGDRSSPTCC